jgi:hypothetical protein
MPTTIPTPTPDGAPDWLRRQWHERRAIVAWVAATATGAAVACLAAR